MLARVNKTFSYINDLADAIDISKHSFCTT
jgi:hypothetical protein